MAHLARACTARWLQQRIRDRNLVIVVRSEEVLLSLYVNALLYHSAKNKRNQVKHYKKII